jgi:hypothetical protein
MTPAELRQQAHAALDAMLDAAAKIEGGDAAVQRWCRGLICLFSAITAATRQRQYGKASFAAPVVAGAPDDHRAIEAGFIASVK